MPGHYLSQYSIRQKNKLISECTFMSATPKTIYLLLTSIVFDWFSMSALANPNC